MHKGAPDPNARHLQARSQVLITTLIDEVVFGWREVTKLYLQRYCVELAFRHLKTRIGIERIRKRKLLRIEQLLFAAIVLFNLSAALRNRIRRPSLLPEKAGYKATLLHIMHRAGSYLPSSRPGAAARDQEKDGFEPEGNQGCWFIYKHGGQSHGFAARLRRNFPFKKELKC
ncbi:transposase [Pontiella sulfatireligans]|uniref:transposase n=1 Tax=Pontiella sulfatireligans TaxID=2750658 RepID=UPI0014447668|nr:transposase [Pontiella sulfatireligans]